MVSLNRIPTRLAAVLCLLALPACTVTFRRKPIEPLDNDRNYPTVATACWDAAKGAVAAFADGIESEEYDTANDTGMLVTDYSVFADTGDQDWKHLKKVAYAQGAPFIGGRYQLTLTTRTIRGGDCKVRVVARIEGYMGESYGYQALRSNGVLEQTIFDQISTTLGTQPSGQ